MKMRLVGVGGAFALLTVVASCLDPTEIDVVISMNVPSSELPDGGVHAAILVGSPDTVLTSPTTSIMTSNAPDSTGSFGDIVIVPSSSDGTVAIEVALGVGQSTASCIDSSPDKSGCIITTRQIQYVPHHRLTLPITLDSACLGITCAAGYTCVNGDCRAQTTECDGGTCDTIDASFGDAVAGCASPKTACGTKCVDLLINGANCGACGFDCTKGTCVNGSCVLDSSVVGKCLAVYGTNVFVVTPTGSFISMPTTGGTFTTQTSAPTPAYDVQSTGAAMIVSGKGPNTYAVMTFPPGSRALTSIPNHVAVDPMGFGWIDTMAGNLYYWTTTVNTEPQPLKKFGASGVDSRIATASGVAYAALTETDLCRAATPQSVTCVTATGTSVNVTNPTEVAVSDAASSKPTVYDVENKRSEINQFDSLLQTKTAFATGGVGLGAIVVGSAANTTATVYSVAPASIYKVTSGSMGVLTSLTGAQMANPQCIALSTEAVFWLGSSSGLYKHAR